MLILCTGVLPLEPSKEFQRESAKTSMVALSAIAKPKPPFRYCSYDDALVVRGDNDNDDNNALLCSFDCDQNE